MTGMNYPSSLASCRWEHQPCWAANREDAEATPSRRPPGPPTVESAAAAPFGIDNSTVRSIPSPSAATLSSPPAGNGAARTRPPRPSADVSVEGSRPAARLLLPRVVAVAAGGGGGDAPFLPPPTTTTSSALMADAGPGRGFSVRQLIVIPTVFANAPLIDPDTAGGGVERTAAASSCRFVMGPPPSVEEIALPLPPPAFGSVGMRGCMSCRSMLLYNNDGGTTGGPGAASPKPWPPRRESLRSPN